MSLMWVYTPAGLPNADTIAVIRYPPSAACQSNSWDEKKPRADQWSNPALNVYTSPHYINIG